MGRWIHHHSTTNIRVGTEFGELADFILVPSDAINEVKVDWLRPQTHKEWFPHSLHAYAMCFRPFTCPDVGQMLAKWRIRLSLNDIMV
jgi:hypothetical protein